MSSPHRLTGQQVGELVAALTAGFDRSDLRALVRIELNEDLDAIAGGETLQELALSLVDWAEETGRVEGLIAAMQRRNPTSPEVQALAASAAGWFHPPATSPVQVASAVPPATITAAPPQETRQSTPLPATGSSSPSRLLLLGGLLLLLAAAVIVAGLNLLGDRRREATVETLPNAAATAPVSDAEATDAAATDASNPAAIPTAEARGANDANASAGTAGMDTKNAASSVPALAVGVPDQEWHLGTRVYRVLAASATQINPSQTEVNLQLRMTNNSWIDDSFHGLDMRLVTDDSEYEASDHLRTCYVLVERDAARDDCALKFVVDGTPEALTLRITNGDAQASIPLTLGPALPHAAPTPALAAAPPLTVRPPAGAFPVGPVTYQVTDATAEPYDAARTVVKLRLVLTNNDAYETPFLGSYVRLLEDGVPRAPADEWVNTCLSAVPPGQTSDQCTVDFVVANTAAELTLRFFDAQAEHEALAPLPIDSRGE